MSINEITCNRDTSSVTSLYATFSRSRAFNSTINAWDVSRVHTMHNTFSWAASFAPSNLSAWDVSSCTTLQDTFYQTPFSGSVASWNLASLVDINAVFGYAGEFDGDLSRWSTAGVADFAWTFKFASRFNSDLSKWFVRPKRLAAADCVSATACDAAA